MRIQKKQVIPFLLALLFTVYYGGITLFPHVHFVNNTIVSHSHPYSNPTHSHSEAVMQILSELSNITLTIPVLGAALLVFRSILPRIEEKSGSQIFPRVYTQLQLRGPPQSH